MSPAIPPDRPGVSSSRVERLAAGFGLAAFSTLLFLGLLEGGLRLYDRVIHGAPLVQADPIETLYLSHPYLPTILRPSTDYRDADTAGHINALGLRGPDRPVGKAPGSVRILCVGGSTTFGAGIVGDEKTWPARLESRLAELRPGLPIEVWNAGVPGYTTAENIIYLGLRLIDLGPDLVVFYEGYNDFKPNRHPGFRSDYSHWRDRAVVPQRDFLDGFRIYTRLRSLIDYLRARPAARVRDPRTGAGLERFDSVSEEGVAIFRRNLRTLIAVARSAGGAPVLATYAHPCTDDNAREHPELFSYLPGFLPGLTFAGVKQAFDRYNEAIRSVAAEQGATLADAARLMPADPFLFVDHVHFNPRGADAFARVVAESILPVLPAIRAAPARQVPPAPALPRADSRMTSR